MKRALCLLLALVMLVGVFATSVFAEEAPTVSSVEIHFYYNGADLDVDPIVENLPIGMKDNLADWLDERLNDPGLREPLQIPEGYALQNDVWYWISNDAVVANSHKTVDGSGNPKVCRVYLNVVDEIPNAYAVKFRANSKDAKGIMDFQYVGKGTIASLTPNAYTLEGYTFAGWNTRPDGSGISFADMQPVLNIYGILDEVELYAQWTKNGTEPALPSSVFGTYDNAISVLCSNKHHGARSYAFKVSASSDITMSECGSKAYVRLSNEDVQSILALYNRDSVSMHRYVAKETPVITLKYNSGILFFGGYWTVENVAVMPVTCDCELCCSSNHSHTVTYTDGVENAVIFQDIKYVQKHGDYTKVPVIPTRPGYKFAGWTPCVSKYVHKCVTYTATWIRTGGPSLTTAHVAYLKGYGGGLVKPEGNITRAEAISILYRLMDAPSTKAYYTTYNAFTDVAKDAWYNEAVSTLANAGVLKVTTGLLNPDEAITRAEFFYMLTKFSGVSYTGKCTFKDVPACHWAYEELALAQYLGWVKGYGGSTVKPDDTITRAEVAASLNRVLGRTGCALRDTKNYKDNPANEWYYKDIVEASIAH